MSEVIKRGVMDKVFSSSWGSTSGRRLLKDVVVVAPSASLAGSDLSREVEGG